MARQAQHNRSISVLAVLTAGVALAGCSSKPSGPIELPLVPPRTPASSLDQLAGWMTGTFSSADQAASDPEYRPIVLHMAPIWAARTDGRWFYVEQALASTPDKPYRQRVYRLTAYSASLADRYMLRSDVFTLPGDPLAFAGAWRDPKLLAELKPEQLALRDGCALVLEEREDGSYRGSTLGRGCPSELNGAAYAVSEATILPDRLITWDRGFDDKNAQVWGATKGGYVFKRQAP